MEGKNRKSKSKSSKKCCSKKVEAHNDKNNNEMNYPCPCGGNLPPPPDKPPTDDELWDLQFSRWWGWNWVRRHEDVKQPVVACTNVKTSTQQFSEPCCKDSPPERLLRTCEMSQQPSPRSRPQGGSTCPARRAKEAKKNKFKSFCKMCKCFYKENKQRMRKMEPQEKKNLQCCYDTPCASIQADDYERNSVLYERSTCGCEGQNSVSTVIYQKESRSRKCRCARMQSWIKEKSETTSSDECFCRRLSQKQDTRTDPSVNYLSQRMHNVVGGSQSTCCCDCKCHSCCCCFYPQKLEGFVKCPCVLNMSVDQGSGGGGGGGGGGGRCCCCGGGERAEREKVEVATTISECKPSSPPCGKRECMDKAISARNLGIEKTCQTAEQQQHHAQPRKHCCCCRRSASKSKSPQVNAQAQVCINTQQAVQCQASVPVSVKDKSTKVCSCKGNNVGKPPMQPLRIICCPQKPCTKCCKCCVCTSRGEVGSSGPRQIEDRSRDADTNAPESTIVNFATVYCPNAKEYFKSPHSGQIYNLQLPGLPFTTIPFESKKFPKLLDLEDKSRSIRKPAPVLNTDIKDAEHQHILSSVCDALMTAKEPSFMDTDFLQGGIFGFTQPTNIFVTNKPADTPRKISEIHLYSSDTTVNKDDDNRSSTITEEKDDIKRFESTQVIQTKSETDSFTLNNLMLDAKNLVEVDVKKSSSVQLPKLSKSKKHDHDIVDLTLPLRSPRNTKQFTPMPAATATGLYAATPHTSGKGTQIKLTPKAKSLKAEKVSESTCTPCTKRAPKLSRNLENTSIPPMSFLAEKQKQRIAKETSVAIETNLFTTDTLSLKARGFFRTSTASSRTNLFSHAKENQQQETTSKTYDVLYSNLENIRKICNSPMSLLSAKQDVSQTTSAASGVFNSQMQDLSLENIESVLQSCMRATDTDEIEPTMTHHSLKCGTEIKMLTENDDERLLTCIPPKQLPPEENGVGQSLDFMTNLVSLSTSISDKIKFFEVLNSADEQEETPDDAKISVDEQGCQTNVFKVKYQAARNKEKMRRDRKRK